MNGPPEKEKGPHANAGATEVKTRTATYEIAPFSAMEIAVAVIARRYRLRPHIARVIVGLAGIGGAA